MGFRALVAPYVMSDGCSREERQHPYGEPGQCPAVVERMGKEHRRQE